MFTGIVKEIGKIRDIPSRKSGISLSVNSPVTCKEIKEGDSILVDGVCLTAEKIDNDGFSAYASSETLKKTTLKYLSRGNEVNVEPSLKAGEPVGGHIVQGHVEGIGETLFLKRKGEEALFKVEIPSELARYVAEKGSIAISGVSLTVSKIEGYSIEMVVVPFTLNATTLKNLKTGNPVNIETDIVARQVVSYLEKKEKLTLEKLVDEGF